MLFRKNIQKQCSYCKHAAKINDHTMICVSKGIVGADSHCGRFRYDPLKRVPEPPARLHHSQQDDADYSL